MEFNVTIADPARTSPCFDDLLGSVRCSLGELGHTTVSRGGFDPGRINIVFGYYLAVHKFPSRSIVYQLEPVTPETIARGHVPIAQLRRHVVWDYSRHHVRLLRGYGIDARYVPVGYSPDLRKVTPAVDQDIDVLFYGSASGRRLRIIRELAEAGLGVEYLCGVYGARLAPYIARAKVVLNLHGHDSYRTLESVRVGFLLANGKAVVTEANRGDDLDELADGMFAVPYHDVVEACRYLVRDDAARRGLESAGFQLISARPEREVIAGALAGHFSTTEVGDVPCQPN